jgi:hypothetical protein
MYIIGIMLRLMLDKEPRVPHIETGSRSKLKI